MFPSAQTQQFPWKVLLLGHRIYVYSILLDNITLYPIVMVAIYFCNYLCFCLPVNPYFFHDFILSVFFKFAFHCLWIIKWKTLHDFWSLVFPTLSNICFYFSICFQLLYVCYIAIFQSLYSYKYFFYQFVFGLFTLTVVSSQEWPLLILNWPHLSFILFLLFYLKHLFPLLATQRCKNVFLFFS